MEDLAADLYREVFEVGGTISGEHGDGLSRTPFIRQHFGELLRRVPRSETDFDPLGHFESRKDRRRRRPLVDTHPRPAIRAGDAAVD